MQFYMNIKDYSILRHCGIIDENPNEWVEIDELIAESVKLLNIKGYTTTFSCQGHLYRGDSYYGVCGAYISFDNTIDIGKFAPPDGWYVDNEITGSNAIRHDYGKFSNHHDAIMTIMKTVNSLYEWAEMLPEAEDTNVKKDGPELYMWNCTCNTPEREVCYGAICETPDEAIEMMLAEITAKESPCDVPTNISDYELDYWGSMGGVNTHNTKEAYECGICVLYNCGDVQLVVKRTPATPVVTDKCIFFIGGK